MGDLRRHAVHPRSRRQNAWCGAAIAAGAVVTVAAVVAIAATPIAVALARSILVPPNRREEGTGIVNVDHERGTITFRRTRDAVTDGRLSFWFHAATGHARIGSIVSETPRTVTRELLRVDFGDIDTAQRGRFNGWFYLNPSDLGVDVENVDIETELGPAPAWIVQPEPGKTSASENPWVIMIHGRAVKRAETIRAVPVFRAAGYTSLLVSYRNDSEAPSTEDGRYSLGDTEWKDVEAALDFAQGRGATSVVLMGWSMGGATALQTVTRSRLSHMVVGLVLESPVINWVDALDFQAQSKGIPKFMSTIVYSMMQNPWGRPFTGLKKPLDLRRLNFVRRAPELVVPTLILHSEADGYIPFGPSRALAQARPDIVTLELFDTAGHTKLWNFDPERWSRAIKQWLAAIPTRPALASARKAHSLGQREAG